MLQEICRFEVTMNLSDYIPELDVDFAVSITLGTFKGDPNHKYKDGATRLHEFAVQALRDFGNDGFSMPGKISKAIAVEVDREYPDANIVIRTLVWTMICQDSLIYYLEELRRKEAAASPRKEGPAGLHIVSDD